MKSKLVITIAREFGAEGHEIGKELAARLGFKLYDKDLLGLAAKKSGVGESSLASADEAVWDEGISPYMTIRNMSPSKGERLYQKQQEIVMDLAAKGSCVIVGRATNYILQEHPDCIKVFIYAPLAFRVRNIMEKHHINESQAKKLVKKMDAARKSYHAVYTNEKWNQKEGKDILLNREAFGVKGCVDILEAMAKARDPKLKESSK